MRHSLAVSFDSFPHHFATETGALGECVAVSCHCQEVKMGVQLLKSAHHTAAASASILSPHHYQVAIIVAIM